jgi:hypothetical protein
VKIVLSSGPRSRCSLLIDDPEEDEAAEDRRRLCKILPDMVAVGGEGMKGKEGVQSAVGYFYTTKCFDGLIARPSGQSTNLPSTVGRVQL